MGLDQRKYNIIGIVKISFESSLTLFMQDISIYFLLREHFIYWFSLSNDYWIIRVPFYDIKVTQKA